MQNIGLILDTNIYVSNFLLDNINFKLLSYFIEKESYTNSNFKLILPSIVKEEVIKKYQENLETSINNTEKEINILNKLITEKIKHPQFDIDNYTSNYSNLFVEKLQKISLNKFQLSNEYEKTDLQLIKDRCLKKLKPFSNDGQKGFRDAIIWEHIKDLINNENYKIIFVSNNSSDFSMDKQDNKDKLHKQLQNELAGELIYYTSLDALFKDNLYSNNKVEELNTFFQKNISNYYPTIKDFLEEDTHWLHHDILEIPRIAEEINIEELRIDSFKVKYIAKHKDNIDILKINLSCYINVSYYLYKADYYCMGDDESGNVNIMDSDWNDDYLWAESDANISMDLLIEFNQKKQTMLEIQIA